MEIKTSKGIKEVNEVFTDLESLKNHILKLDKNIRYDNETIKKEIESLMVKLKEQEGIVSLSLMRGWLVKNYGFKTYEEAELACLTKLIEIIEGGYGIVPPSF